MAKTKPTKEYQEGDKVIYLPTKETFTIRNRIIVMSDIKYYSVFEHPTMIVSEKDIKLK